MIGGVCGHYGGWWGTGERCEEVEEEVCWEGSDSDADDELARVEWWSGV